MNVQIERDFIFFDTDTRTAQRMDAKFLKSRNLWRVPNTIGALRELHRAGFDVMDHAQKKKRVRDALLDIKGGNVPVTLYDKRLRPYQRTDIDFLSKISHGAIFNEQRTGKTPTVLSLVEYEQPERVVICCPTSVILQFSKEVENWTEYQPIPYIGTPKKREKLRETYTKEKKVILLASPQTIKQDVDHLKKLKDFYFIVDEAHFLRNYQTQQSKAIYQIGKNAAKRIAMTGTPSVSKGDDVYGILHFLYPDKFTSYWDFIDRYFNVWSPPWGGKEVQGYKRQAELQEILDIMSVQRKRKEVMPWLPPKQYQTVELEMGRDQKKHYNEMLHDFETGDYEAVGVLDQLIRLRQLCLDPKLLGIKAPSAKEQYLLQWIKDHPDESVIVFSNFSSYLKDLHTTLYQQNTASGLIIGETPKEERFVHQMNFQNGNTKILLANIQAAGTGLTLDAGTTVIFLDRHFNPSYNDQAEDRIVSTQEGNATSATIIDISLKDTVDENLSRLLRKKVGVTRIVNDYKNIQDKLLT